MFLVKSEESRSFDVCFWVFGREKKMCREAGQKANLRKECLLPICGVFGAIYSPRRVFKGDGPSRATGLERF